jgi:hypothetical protein
MVLLDLMDTSKAPTTMAAPSSYYRGRHQNAGSPPSHTRHPASEPKPHKNNQQELTMILLTDAANTQTALQPQHKTGSIFLIVWF